MTRAYSSNKGNNSLPIEVLMEASVVYEDAYSMKKAILKENKGRAGIYMWSNKLTGDIYVGQSKDLSQRFQKYFNLSYIKSREELIISRALIKYGGSRLLAPQLPPSNFSGMKKSYSTISKDSHLITPISQIKIKMNPWVLTGFSDAESTFHINIHKSVKSKLGWYVQPKFSIGLHLKDSAILYQIRATLGVG